MTIADTLERWHRFAGGGETGILDEILAEDAVFHSPVVFTPQKGKELTKLYLMGAFRVFGGGDPESSSFRYTKELQTGPHAVLEFEAEVDGKHVNGVDIISFDSEGRICEFRVMVRPLQAINLLHQKMAAMLSELAPRD